MAALLPPLVGALTILLSFLGLRLATGVTSLSVFALNLVTGMGLGLSIDWSLLVVSRFREELVAAREGAVARTIASAGRTVVFSALTVAAAMASLLVFPQRFLFSMGVGGVLVSLVGGAVSLVVLPAVLALLGPRVNSLAPRRWQRAPEGRGLVLARAIRHETRTARRRCEQRLPAAARAAVLARRLHRRGRTRSAGGRERAAGVRAAQERLHAADGAVLRRGSGQRAEVSRFARQVSALHGNPRVATAARARAGRLDARRVRGARLPLERLAAARP